MSTQPEALRLANALEKYWGAERGHDRERQAAAELRRLHAVNEELLEALEELALYIAHNGDDWVQKKARAAIAKATGEQA
jgi:hypothetical protein